MKSILSLLSYLLIIYLLTGCSDQPSAEQPNSMLSSSKAYIETGDLNKLRKRGELRILTTSSAEAWLPRSGPAFNEEFELAIKLAKALKLTPTLVVQPSLEQLIPALLEGRGDIIVNNLTVTESRKASVAFSLPLTHSRERIIRRVNDKVNKLSGLRNRSVAYLPGSSFAETLAELQQQVPGLKIEELPSELDEDQILDRLRDQQIDLGVMDSNRIEVLKSYRDDFASGPAISKQRSIAWAVRPDNSQLLEAANLFLTKQRLSQPRQPLSTADLGEIKQRKTLRVITRNNAASYFLWRGELLGFEYELAKKFAETQGLRIEVIVAADHDAQIDMLLQGKGDLIASFMSITERRKTQDIVFSRPYHYAHEMIVTRSKDKKLSTVNDINGRTFHVRRSSAYWDTLQSLLDSGEFKFSLIAVAEQLETEDIIARVASGEYDLTLADEHIFDIENTWRDDIRGLAISDKQQRHGWVMRKSNPQLISAVNQFHKKHYRQLFYNVTYNKYFKTPHSMLEFRDQRVGISQDGSLSPYDTLVKKYAEEYGFDWRLIVAQMYQESRFDPNAESWVGAQGLMQVMPRTARELGISNLQQPEAGIRAGVMYLDWVRDRFEQDLDIRDRMWFTLAAYNAGQGHVRDARRLAAQLGMNPDRWFDHVEKAMLLLSKREYARKARHGYVRGSEPVNYVRDIRKRYQAYIELL